MDEEERPRIVSFISIEELVDRVGAGDPIFSVGSENGVLQKNGELREGLMLLVPYVLGGFL